MQIHDYSRNNFVLNHLENNGANDWKSMIVQTIENQ